MSELIAVPTVEQINLEHQLANNKAAEAIQHATNCGLMLLQVKASLSHGEWLPWLNGEIDSGKLIVKVREAQNYMRLASNTQRVAYLPETTSIRAALELLSDKEPDAEQADMIPVDLEAERQAREEAERMTDAWRFRWEKTEESLLEHQQRNRDWQEQSNKQRQHIEALEQRIDHFDSEPKPEPVKVVERVEVIPADYEAIKAKAAQLETELATNQAEQTRIIQSAIKAKLSGYQGEVDALEAKKNNLEKQAKDYQDYLASLQEDEKQMEAQARALEKSRQALMDLADELAGFRPVSEKLNRQWQALIKMHQEATETMSQVFPDSPPILTLIQGSAA